jgi:hypothetical protein
MEGQQRDGQRGQAPGTAWLEPVKGVYSPDTAYKVVCRLFEVTASSFGIYGRQ